MQYTVYTIYGIEQAVCFYFSLKKMSIVYGVYCTVLNRINYATFLNSMLHCSSNLHASNIQLSFGKKYGSVRVCAFKSRE